MSRRTEIIAPAAVLCCLLLTQGAIGPGPAKGVDYIYLADIGDNSALLPKIHRF